jgi:cobyrinic acid a,c-diamide synthase
VNIPRLVIAGTHSGVGKTTVTLALLAALHVRGRRVQPFKVGPDFIDPGHHRLAAGRASRNVDGWMLDGAANRRIVTRAAEGADISIIEGMMGLFDGSSPISESGSTAEMAKALAAPVLLVIDGSAMARSAAAMLQGYARFDTGLNVAGVLFNRISSEGHFRLLKEAVEAVSNIAVVGYLPPDASLTIEDRHLGLVTALEHNSRDVYDRLGRAAANTVDLDLIEALAQAAMPLSGTGETGTAVGQGSTVRIGVACDPAFCFYYQENLDMLETQGGAVTKFSPLRDPALPEADLLYLGGGYPELYGEALSRNASMRHAIKQFALRGGPIYAECGGLMYLTEAIRDFDGHAHDMVGLFPAETVMRKAGLTLGYRTVELAESTILGPPGLTAKGHEFHYSTLVPKGPLEYAVRLVDARGEARGMDGLRFANTLAMYTHLHFASQPSLAQELVRSAHAHRLQHAPNPPVMP